MSEDRNWRDAKMPQWVKDSIERELAASDLTAALSWPTEVRPQPMSFQWGEYDRLNGTAEPGVYWAVNGSVDGTGRIEKVHIKRNEKHGETWKSWAFSSDGERWSTSVVRGLLFDDERDARLWLLWNACEAFAARLLKIRKDMK